MTVEANIGFGLRQEGMAKDKIAERVDEAMAMLELGQFAKRKPHQLSGGQQQRVALARAIAKKPRLVLLDEPLGALDKKLRQQAQFELMRIQETTGTTFIIVTHDQEEAMTVASRIAVMDKGDLVQVATPGEIYENPKTRYIAGFIGDVNVFEGKVSARIGGLHRDRRQRRLQVQDAEHRARHRRPAGVAGAPAREDPHRPRATGERRQRHSGQGRRYRLSRIDLALSCANRAG